MKRTWLGFVLVGCAVLIGSPALGAPWAVVANLGDIDGLTPDDPGFLGEAIYTVDLGTTPPTAYGPFFNGDLDYDGGGALDVTYLPNGTQVLLSIFSHTNDPDDPDPPLHAGGKVWLIDIRNPTNPVLQGVVFLEEDTDGDDVPDRGMFAEDIAVAPNGAFAVVADGGFSSTIAFIDLRTFSLNGLFELYLGVPFDPDDPPDPLPLLLDAQAVAIGPDNETVIMVDYWGGSVVYGRVNAARDGLESVNELVLCPNWDPDAETCGPEEYHSWPLNVSISPDGATAIVPDAWWGMVSVLSITGPGQVQPGTPFQLWGLGDTYADFVAREYGDGRPARAAGQSVAFSPDGARAYLVQNGTYEWEDTNPDPDVFVWDFADDPPNQLSWIQITGPGSAAVGGVWVADLLGNNTGGYYGVDTIAVTPDGAFALVTNPTSGGCPCEDDDCTEGPCLTRNASLVNLETWGVSPVVMNAGATTGVDIGPLPMTVPVFTPLGGAVFALMAAFAGVRRLRRSRS